jgi:hypothetical protein
MILMAPIQNFVICYVIEGESYYAQKKLQEFAQKLLNNNSLWRIIEEAATCSEVLNGNKVPSLTDLITEIFLQKTKEDYALIS